MKTTVQEQGLAAARIANIGQEALANPSDRLPWLRIGVVVVVLTIVLSLLPGRSAIPPLVESDYCYLLTAADRLYGGEGLTTTPPVAPFQPWKWSSDWTFLTKWPAGYPLLVYSVRTLTGFRTLDACSWIGMTACAAALVGWFVWVRRLVPDGVTGTLLAAVSAGTTVSTAFLINPSTDLLIIAMLPYVLLVTTRAMEIQDRSRSRRVCVQLVLGGFLAGSLFWIRYASLFVPLAIGIYLVLARGRASLGRWWRIAAFSAGALPPILALILMNRAFAAPPSIQEQFNLGGSVSLNLSWSLIGTAWWTFTDLGFYNYHRIGHWVFALWPVILLPIALVHRTTRKTLFEFYKTPGLALGLATLTVLLSMLIGTTILFGDKYHYVGLDRYYAPVRPLYFLLFVGPILLISRRWVRGLAAVGLVVACSWTVQQEWARTYKRWQAANREVTPYGQWARCFSPGASALYGFLSTEKSDDLIVVSNFHDHIALETGIPAVPIPKTPAVLHTWIDEIAKVRGMDQPRILFVLDPDNRWRDYFIPPHEQVVDVFGLTERVEISGGVSASVFRYAPVSTLPARRYCR